MILFLIFLLALPLSAEPLCENQARLGAVSGDVGLLSQGADTWIAPQPGLPLEPGDHIRTGEDGRAEIAFSDKALWALEPQTEVVTEHTDTHRGRIDLNAGVLIGKVDSEQAAGSAQRWEFYTPAAVIAIRGTEFVLDVSQKEGTRLGVFEGTVEMQPAETAEGQEPPQDIAAGHEALAQRNRPIQILSRFSPRLAALAARRTAVRRRQQDIENTWSPFTPTVRTELRHKLVAPPVKHRAIRRAPARKRSRSQTTPLE
jgi:hypothetical protein